jgi:hypothetical protein
MIVRPNGSSRLLITQSDHAALAARIMRSWRADGFPQSARQTSILQAIEQHDNGWREVDASPLLDSATGSVLDFITAPDEIRRSVWPRGVERLAATPYAAALVAQHALHIYRRYRPDSGWTPFFREMESARDRHLREIGTLDDLLQDYFFVRVGDLASLTFCNGWTEVQTDDSGSGYGIRLDGSRLAITPDPFEGEEVLIEVTAREIPDRRFLSAAEASEMFRAAPEVVLTGVATGGRRL